MKLLPLFLAAVLALGGCEVEEKSYEVHLKSGGYFTLNYITKITKDVIFYNFESDTYHTVCTIPNDYVDHVNLQHNYPEETVEIKP